jgi:plastocyanin
LKATHSEFSRSLLRIAPLTLMAAAMLTAAIASGYQSAGVTSGGMIVGTIRYGAAPPKPKALEVSKDRDVCGVHPLFDQSLIVGPVGGIANAVVTLPEIEKGKALQPQTAVFDQKACTYVPHVAAFPAGSTVEVRNSDGILHNIHTESTLNPVIDMAQPGFKKTIRITVSKPETIKVTCDAHNWMEGWWYVTANPYYAVSDEHGHYQITDVPAGTYSLEVWQEKLGVTRQQVSVKPGTTNVANFTLSAKK